MVGADVDEPIVGDEVIDAVRNRFADRVTGKVVNVDQFRNDLGLPLPPRGRLVRTHEIVVNLIANTTNRGGLVVQAQIDRGKYPTGKKVSAREFRAIKIERDELHGAWNYVIRPREQAHVAEAPAGCELSRDADYAHRPARASRHEANHHDDWER